MAVRVNDGGVHYLSRTATLPSAADISVGCWVYVDATGDFRPFWELGDGTFSLLYVLDTPGNGMAGYTPDGGSTSTSGTASLSSSAWYYVALTRAANGTMTAYTGTTPGTLSALSMSAAVDGGETPTVLSVGANNAGSNPIDGRIAHLRIWSGALLSEAEFETESTYTTAQKTSGLWAEYRFGSGALTTDSGGSSRSLTATGTPTFIADPSGLTEGGGGGGVTAAVFMGSRREQKMS